MSASNDKTYQELENELAKVKAELDELKLKYANDLKVLSTSDNRILKEREFSAKILDCLPGIFYLYSYPELRLVLWNKNHETQLGFTADEIANRYIMDWHIPGVEPIVQQAVDLVMEKGQNVLESPLLNKQGVYIPFLMTGVKFEMDNKQYLMGFGIDITERKKIEKAREESEALFRLLAENSTDMISRHDELGNYIYVSPSCKLLLGYEPDELVGHSAFEFIHKDDLLKIEESRKNVVSIQASSTSTYRIKRKDGTYIWFETISRAITDHKNGNVNEIHASSRDVTERKNWEEKTLENEQKLRALFGSMTEMVALHEVVFDDNGKAVNYRIIDINDAYTRITGIKREDAVGKLATEVYQQEQPPYLDEFSKVGITGVPFEYNTFYAPMDKYFMISVVSPGKNKFATITTDITAIQLIQETITEKNKELENYLYVASHDLRSPLVNIQGFSQRLQKQVDSLKNRVDELITEPESKAEMHKIMMDDLPKTLNFIFSNVTKMDTLINGLLQISRTGRIKMTIKKVDMENLFNHIANALNFQITEVGAKLSIHSIADCYGDSNQLNQLFSNIIVNALKYRDPQKPLKIEIQSNVKYNKVVYSISDTGIGIASRHQKRIWDVFYRVDSGLPSAGEGLGLSIAKRIADKHKGKIWVESEEGRGSTFFVELQRNEFNE